MRAEHRGPFGGMVIICVEPGTEVVAEDGETAVVDDSHTVVSGKGALYVTPRIYALLRDNPNVTRIRRTE
jgi:hypothetical protein